MSVRSRLGSGTLWVSKKAAGQWTDCVLGTGRHQASTRLACNSVGSRKRSELSHDGPL